MRSNLATLFITIFKETQKTKKLQHINSNKDKNLLINKFFLLKIFPLRYYIYYFTSPLNFVTVKNVVLENATEIDVCVRKFILNDYNYLLLR